MAKGAVDRGLVLCPSNTIEAGLLGKFKDLASNAVFIVVAYLAWRLLRRWPAAVSALLAGLAAVAVWRFTMLGIAVVGLFIRPRIGRQLVWAVQVALLAAAFMLGLLLIDGASLVRGLTLGVVAFGAQIIVGFALTRRLPMPDRIHLAFAQQNGITAIILALLLEAEFHGVIAVVAPAILTINLIHLAANHIIDHRDPSTAAAGHGSEP